MAHPLSAVYGLHHGLANALCLPICVEHTFEKSKGIPSLNKKLAQIAKLFTNSAIAEDLPKLIREFIENLGISMGLENYNIKPENLEKLSHLALEDSCHHTHPYSVNKLDFQNCFTEALIG